MFALVLVSVLPGPAEADVARKLPDGVYAVARDSLKKKDLLPLKAGEVLAVDNHPYLKKEEAGPPRFLVVRCTPDVTLDLAAEPKASKEGEVVVRIRLKLRPRAAADLERLTRARLGRQVAVVLDGRVVTVHKVRAVIKGGDVEITSCAPGGAAYLLKCLQAHHKKKGG
jgi:preprotein translocase subunit SecD